MLIYLDLCCFNRPFDDQSSRSIYIETEAKLFIQDMIKQGLVEICLNMRTALILTMM